MQWRWQVRLNGIYASGVETDEERAIAARKACIDSIRDRTFHVRREAEGLTLRSALKRHVLEAKRLKDSDQTRRELELLAARVEAYCEKLKFVDLAVDQIRKTHMLQYRDARLDAGRAASTVASEMYLVSAVYEAAIENWGMDHLRNPTMGKDASGNRVVPSGAVGRDRSKARRLAPDEILAFVREARTVAELPEIIGVGLLTGLRLGQVISLQKGWVDFNSKAIRFPDRSRRGRRTRSKNERGQVVPLSDAALDVLDRLPVQDDGRYFTRTTVAISVAVNRIRHRLKLPPFSYHTLRHHVNSLLHDVGLSAEERANALGQRTPAVNVEHYTHVDQARVRAALARVKAKTPRQAMPRNSAAPTVHKISE